MHTLREWLIRLWGTFRPRRSDADLEQELRAHLELAAEAQGCDAAAAARPAILRAGAVAPSMEAMRDQRGLRWLEEVARDVRHASRALRRTPAFSVIVILTLAIGIAANITVFSVVNGVLLKPLPYPNPDELVAVWQSAPGAEGLAAVSGGLRLSASMYFTYSEQNRAFAHLGAWYVASATVTGTSDPEEVRAAFVSDGVLQALGVQPLGGRWLSAADQVPGGPRTVIVSEGYLQRRFGAGARIVGQTMLVDSQPYEIVGVMPRGFRIVDADADLILPIRFDRSRAKLPGFGFQGVARLKPGVSLAEANADLARMVPIWMSSWPAASGVDPRVYENWRIAPALRPLVQDIVGNVGKALWVVMGTLGIVLMIACANVATLILVRAEGRQQELAIRAALGAGSRRIVRALLVESLLLALAGGACGLALAYVGTRALLALSPGNLPRLEEITIDGPVFVFALGISLLSGLVFGLIPALRHASPRVAASLGAGGRTMSDSLGRLRGRHALVVAQVALALVLLVAAGLMIRTFARLQAVDPGFSHAREVLTVRIAIPASLISAPERVARMQLDIVQTLAALPGVTDVALTSDLPMDEQPADWDAVFAETKSYRENEVPPLRLFKSVSPGFFHTVGTRLIAGRDFTWTDMEERRPVIIVSENLAREIWGSPSAALARRMRTLPRAPWREVIGVVQDVRDNGVHEAAPTTVYWPTTTESAYEAGSLDITRMATFVIRSRRAGADGFLKDVQRAVWSINANLPLAGVQTLQTIYEHSMARTSFTLVILAIAGLMALTLGIVGIYGVISYAVAQRTREIGIRLALGAQQAELTRMFVRSALALIGLGVPLGLAAAAALTRLMSALLFGVSPLDPVTYAAVPIVLASAAIVASYVPARRAAAVDPSEALRVVQG
jgi:putative ABC transport system permease protein